MSYSRYAFKKAFRVDSETSSSMHQNVSKGYTQISPNGERVFVPYVKQELAVIHSGLTPKNHYEHMKWTKTRHWKDKTKAKTSKWKYTPTFSGMNTVSK